MLLKKFSRSSKHIFQFRRRYLVYLVFPVLLFFIFSSFKIRSLECKLNDLPCSQNLSLKLESLRNKNYFFVNQAKLISDFNQVEPVDKKSITFGLSGKLTVNLKNNQDFLSLQLFYLQDQPVLSMDQVLISSQSASFQKPSLEIETFLEGRDSTGQRLWSSGLLTSNATVSSNLRLVTSRNLDKTFLSNLYQTLKIITQYLSFNNLTVINNQIFLSRTGQPDIIILVPTDEDWLKLAFSSLDYLTSIKQDTKILDFRFRNPVVR